MAIKIKKRRNNKISTRINGISSPKLANARIALFCFSVILRVKTKSAKYFSKIFVFLNHLSKRSDPLEKQKEAISRKGVVGNGKNGIKVAIMPTPANAKAIKPAMINSNLLIRFIRMLLFKTHTQARIVPYYTT